MRMAFVYFNVAQAVGYGAGLIASLIANRGHQVTFMNTLEAPRRKILEELSAARYDGLWISSMTMTLPEAVGLIQEVRAQINWGLPVFLGGLGPTLDWEQTLEEVPKGTALCLGEGEEFTRLVLDALDHPLQHRAKEIPGLALKTGDTILYGGFGPLEDVSTPREGRIRPWDFFPEDRVMPDGTATLTATRGCPYRCTYCCNASWLDRYPRYLRQRPIEAVIDDALYLKGYGATFLYFADEMALAKPQYAQELFTRLQGEVGLPYGIMARPEALTQEMVDGLVRTGCQYVGIGVECGDERYRLLTLKRRMANEHLREVFDRTRKAGLFRTAFAMIGFPTPEDDLMTVKTVRLLEDLKPDYSQLTIFYPFPGTPLRAVCEAQDFIDRKKEASVKSYYGESILKGRTLRPMLERLHVQLNPRGLTFRAAGLPRTQEATWAPS